MCFSLLLLVLQLWILKQALHKFLGTKLEAFGSQKLSAVLHITELCAVQSQRARYFYMPKYKLFSASQEKKQRLEESLKKKNILCCLTVFLHLIILWPPEIYLVMGSRLGSRSTGWEPLYKIKKVTLVTTGGVMWNIFNVLPHIPSHN